MLLAASAEVHEVLGGGQVVRIESSWEGHEELPQLCAEPSDYAADLFKGNYRTDIKPLDITQPEGPSFTVRPSPSPSLPNFLRAGLCRPKASKT